MGLARAACSCLKPEQPTLAKLTPLVLLLQLCYLLGEHAQVQGSVSQEGALPRDFPPLTTSQDVRNVTKESQLILRPFPFLYLSISLVEASPTIGLMCQALNLHPTLSGFRTCERPPQGCLGQCAHP